LRLRVLGIAFVSAGVVVLGFIPFALFATQVAAVHAQDLLTEALPRIATQPATSQSPRRTDPTHGLAPVRLAGRPRVRWPIAVPLGTALARLSIPAAGVRNDVVVEGDDELRLQEGPGHYPSTPLPGESGNVAIAGHRTTWLRPFYDLQAVKPGDQVALQVGSLVYEYRATSVFVVAPNDVSVVRPLRGWWLTLTTCNPRYSAAQRLVVRAELEDVESVAARPATDTGSPHAAPVIEVRVPPPVRVFHATPWPVLVVWLVLAGVIASAAFALVRRTRFAWMMLIPAAACCFEAYGAAVQLLPASW
jgi:sortase A